MSTASRSKSKDKKAAKETAKSSLKPSGHVNSNGGIPASGYNPLSGTFHTFETAPVPSVSPLHANGRFRTIDDADDHNGNSSGTGVEYDSVSNNGSWSGESEDQKEKASQSSRQESVPGADNDKREKIRQKNERKHQRQKERRAQELHERCSGYLMSRKLESLSHQLVVMGFTQERATMALILNEGRVEESVAWLFEGGEEDKGFELNIASGGNLKIDISEELARITEMEVRYKASKQEVERNVVSCEGNLERAEDLLKTQKQEPLDVPPKPEGTGDPPTPANGRTPPMGASQSVAMRVQVPKAITSDTVQQLKRDEREFNYTKVPTMAGPTTADPGTRSAQTLKKIPPKSEWVKPQQVPAAPVDKRWHSSLGSNNPSVSCSAAPPLQASSLPAKLEARYLAVGNELKNLQLGSVREPVTVMQRPKSGNAKQAQVSSITSLSPPGTAMGGWYPNNSVDTMKPKGPMAPIPSVAVSKSLGPNDVSSNPLYNQFHYQHQSHQQIVPNSSSSMDSQVTATGWGNGSWGRGGVSPTLSAASSLGLFSGLGANGSSGSSSPVDWNTGSSMLHLDYTNIDWSLDLGVLPSRPNGLWGGPTYGGLQNNSRGYDSFAYGLGSKSGMRPVLSSNGNGGLIPGLQEGVAASGEPTAAGSREWTSPFEEKDLFSLPRQFVSSPSL